tara:strand:+ start:993 stop:1997 length:1005 start_codon:yes stop_codon:yes gene_type:complete
MSKLINLNEKIFIAGANGMVGSSVKRNLLNQGYGLQKNGGAILAPNRKELDLMDFNAVDCWFKLYRPSIVVLAAAKVGGILANSSLPADFIFENLKIQNNVIEAAWKNKTKRLLFLGSSCIYPKLAKQPIKEEYLLSDYLEPTNKFYAIAKIAGLNLCEGLRNQYNFDCLSLMPTNLYGPGDNYHPTNSHVMASLIKKFSEAKYNSQRTVLCWGSGSPLREFLHVDDLGKAVIFALEKWDPDSKNAPRDNMGNKLTHLNIGTGLVISIHDLAEKIAKFIGFNGEIIWDSNKPDGTPIKQLNIEKIKSLGWEPTISLDTGIRNTILDFENNYLNK